ncbi:RNA polymerase I-specific transcription initiation factor [Meyerozyma sp. JA9]|nr:RNA polymerase I-specific transcription initiation factor [Meyerozyma sp. JA9]
MIMSLHNPLVRKRALSNPTESSKKQKNDSDDHLKFSEKVYSEYVTAALDAIEQVSSSAGTAKAASILTQNETNQIDGLAAKINRPADHEESISISDFTIVLRVLIRNITRLDNKACQHLVSCIIAYRWLDVIGAPITASKTTFLDLYSHFLSVLVASLPRYLNEVLGKLVNEFPSVAVASENSSDLHHTIIKDILKYVPTSVGSLPTALTKGFPHHLASSPAELTNYVANLLKMLEYCPELSSHIWQMIIESSIKLDVELQNELDDLDDEEIEDLINGEEEKEEERDTIGIASDEKDGENEDEEDEDNDEAASDDEDYLIDPVSSTSDIRKLSQKLDSIIEIILTTSDCEFKQNEISTKGLTIFNSLSKLFQTHILPTHFTKSTQFLLFHISQSKAELSDAFLVMLIDIAFKVDEMVEKRIKAMQYLSSYIARAKSLSRDQVVFVVSYLMEWLNRYVQERECEISDYEDNKTGSKAVGGMERFKLFYAAFQVLIYVFCFRHQMLVRDNSSGEWECEIDQFFQRVIVTKFNPLKYCDETVVFIFAKIATKMNVCYCYSIIEHNKRERMLSTRGKNKLPSAVYNFKSKQEFLDLEAYFPFDPIVLPNSKEIISTNYVEWAEVNPTEDDNEDEESGSYEQDSDESITSEEDD